MQLGCTKNFNLTILLQPIPVPSHGKMLGGSEKKIMCHTSARFDVIILITRILTDTRRSNNILKNNKIWLKNQNSAQAG